MVTPSADAPISPLRQRMQHDMLMRGLGSHTQQDYIVMSGGSPRSSGARPTPRRRTISAASSWISTRTAWDLRRASHRS